MLRTSQLQTFTQDEETPLIPANKEPSSSVTKLILASQITLGIIGIGAGALYFGPAVTCANSDRCGEWLADIISKKLAIGVFAAGGLDYSGINMYMSFESIQVYLDYLNKQTSIGAKIAKGSTVIIYTVAQNVPMLLTSLRTSTAFWQTVLTVSGALPGSLYGATGMMEHEIPYLCSEAKLFSSLAYYYLIQKAGKISETQKDSLARLNYYRNLRQHFNQQLDADYEQIVTTARRIDLSTYKDPLSFLGQQNAVYRQRSTVEKIGHHSATLLGGLVTTNFSTVFISNNYHLLGEYISFLPLQILTTLVLSGSSIYGNLKLTVHGTTAIFDTIFRILTGKPLNSLEYQLRPVTTSVVCAGSLLASALSYAVVNVLYEIEFPKQPNDSAAQNRLRELFRYGALFGISFYHFAGLFMHLYPVMFSKLTQDKREKIFFNVKAYYEQRCKMSLDEFIQFVETEAPQYAYGMLKPFTPVVDAEVGEVKEVRVEKKSSGLLAWCGSWFRSKDESVEERAELGKVGMGLM